MRAKKKKVGNCSMSMSKYVAPSSLSENDNRLSFDGFAFRKYFV